MRLKIMRRLTFLSSLLISALCVTQALAHAELDHANPPVGSTVQSSPRQLTLTFTQNLEPSFSSAEVKREGGGRVDQGVSVSGSTLRVGLGSLSPGTYEVTWHVLSVDTHKTQGSFTFSVGR